LAAGRPTDSTSTTSLIHEEDLLVTDLRTVGRYIWGQRIQSFEAWKSRLLDMVGERAVLTYVERLWIEISGMPAPKAAASPTGSSASPCDGPHSVPAMPAVTEGLPMFDIFDGRGTPGAPPDAVVTPETLSCAASFGVHGARPEVVQRLLALKLRPRRSLKGLQEEDHQPVDNAMPPARSRASVARLVIGTIATLAVVASIVLVWPTPYRYDNMWIGGERVSVRVNRVTGDVDVLSSAGWVTLKP